MNNNIKNFGVKMGERTGDYRAGAKVGALPYLVRNVSGDWEAALPPGERQNSDKGDSQSCVTFAHLNGVETQEKMLTGRYVEYSDRFTAKIGETTREGAYLWQIADAIRKYGLVKEESYPRPVTGWTWDEYHKEIPEPLLSQLKAEGQEWLKNWDVKYESVDFSKESLMKHIKMAPLTVILPGHAVLNFRTTKDIIHYFDSYPPYLKTVPNVLAAMKVMLYPKAQEIPDEYLLVDIKYLDAGKQVEKLTKALSRLGWRNSIQSFSYDKDLANLVFRFQLANLDRRKWVYWWAVFYYRGKLVDAATREIINNALSKKIYG